MSLLIRVWYRRAMAMSFKPLISWPRDSHRAEGTRRLWLAASVLLAGGVLLGGGNVFFPYLSARNPLLVWNAAIGLPLGVLIIRAARAARVPAPRSRWVLAAGLAATLAVEWAAETWWPNSADEYGYVFLARTLLHGRLWNPPAPAPQVFEIAWTFTRGQEWFSQYPPAWPAVLAPFLAAHLAWLAPPLLGLALGALARAGMRELGVRPEAASALLVLLVFSPFVMFNGASLFSHMMAADLVAAIIVVQARDERRRTPANPVAIGALFGLLLLTRYDVFLLAAVPFALDAAWRRRAALLRDAALMAAGGLPFFAAFAGYNAAITGHPLKTPYAWVSGGAKIGLLGKHVVVLDALTEAVLRTLHWTGELVAYAGPVLPVIAAASVWTQLRSRRLRWFDTLLPRAIGFFFLYPNNGGHEFGPRYWFFAWPAAVLGIGHALGRDDAQAGWLQAGRLRLHAPSLAAAHLPVFAGAALSLAAFNHAYVNQRRRVENLVPPERPAVILIPTRSIMVTPWQSVPIVAHSADFCRNGVNLDRDVLYARADNAFAHQQEFAALACTLIDRHIYRWRPPGVIEPVTCP